MNLPPLIPPPLLPPLAALPPLKPPQLWKRSPDANPTAPGWYVTRWRAEFPEARLYWDGVWWCIEIDNHLQRLAHVNIRNWSCEWKTP